MKYLKFRYKLLFLLSLFTLIGCSCNPEPNCSTENNCSSEEVCLDKKCVTLECSPEGINEICGDGNICYNGKCMTPQCTKERDREICGAGNICLYGKCQKDPYACSEDAPYGICPENQKCNKGICKDYIKCSSERLDGECLDIWEECISGVCTIKESEQVLPTEEEFNNLIVDKPLEENNKYLFRSMIPKDGYEKFSNKRMFTAFDWKEKKTTHIFTYRNDVTGDLVLNPKNKKYYYFDWWPDDMDNVELVELDPKVGKLKKKQGFDLAPFDTQMTYISPSGKAIIDIHSGCQTDNKERGYKVWVYDIEKDIKKDWCIKGFIDFHFLKNGDLYALNSEDGNKGIKLYKLDIDNMSIKEINYNNNYYYHERNDVGFTEDGLFFHSSYFHEDKNEELYMVDMFTGESKKIELDFTNFLDNEKQFYNLAPITSNGKYLFLTVWISEYDKPYEDKTRKRKTIKKITMVLDLNTFKYKKLLSSNINSVHYLQTNKVNYNKKYNYIRYSSAIFDLVSLKKYYFIYYN